MAKDTVQSVLDKIRKNAKVKEFIATDEDLEPVTDFISTDCVTLNLAFSGKIDGGIPTNRVSMMSAPSALGKSIIALKLIKNAQRKGMIPILLDTEFAFPAETCKKMGIDIDNLILIQESQLELIQQAVMNIVEPFTKEERKNLFIVLDSFGGLITSKTVNDASTGHDVTDMTISKKKNSFARLLQSLRTTVFIVNHVYDNVGGFGDPLAIPGGRGVYFASSVIILGMSKAKDKEADEISGAIVSCQIRKSRFSKEQEKFKYRIKYDGGIDPYFGLYDIALSYGEELGAGEIKPIEKGHGWVIVNSADGSTRKVREKDLYCKDVWFGVFKEFPGFIKFLEEKFSFKHSEMFDEDLSFDEVIK